MSPHSETARQLVRDLIRCPSVTPQDGGALGLLEERLKPAGFTTHRLRFTETGTPDIDNLYARIGRGAPYLVFAGHTDVVPPGDTAAWRFDPFSGEIADGQVWGRGAADMKGAVAAFAAAALDYAAANPAFKGSIGLLITGDEEGPAVNGTVKLLQWADGQGERFDHCIVGEPTNTEALGDTIKIGRRGSLTGELIVHGTQGHVAYPQRADNPIPHMLRLLAALTEPPLDEGSQRFDPSHLEILTVDVGNPATNVIPAKAHARFNIRFNDLWTPETLEAEIARRCTAVTDGGHYELSFHPCNALAFVTEADHFTDLAVEAIAAHTGRIAHFSTSGGTSDARFVRAYCPVIEFGLVGETMHKIDEHVSLADIDTLTAIYREILDRYFA
ncbi:MAG: succinyl-diaminopimelate desuccinylase [Methylovirgula sp.]|uniref:succinyl-diaminopimelate desuccinylase n=1 Tax=Methylovirgula sp. TaxID=1978224 RepID=UPI00307672E8